MAYYGRRRWRSRFRRFRKYGRRTYRRGFKKYRRNFKKKSSYSRAYRFIKRHTRKAQRSKKLISNIATGNRLFKIQNVFIWELQVNSFATTTSPTTKGHFPYDLILEDILNVSQKNIMDDYAYWNLESLGMTFSIMSCNHMYKTVDTGGSLASYYWNAVAGSNALEFYVGFFNSSLLQNECAALPADDVTNRMKLLQTGRYKRLYLSGNKQSFYWRNNTAHKGHSADSPTAQTIGTALSQAFIYSLSTNNNPHGLDFIWFDSSNYVAASATTGPRATVRVLCTFNAAINCFQRRPQEP